MIPEKCFVPILVICVIFTTCVASAADYYVHSRSGQDGSDGTTEKTAWKSLERVMRAPLQPGDRVLFARGEIWRGQLRPTKNGTPDKPITFGAYGDGPPPSIRGSRLLNDPLDWNQDKDSIWYATSIEHDPIVLVHDNTPGERVDEKGRLQAPWQYWYDMARKRIYVYADQNPARMASEVEIAVFEFVLGPQDAANLVFEDLDIRIAYSSLWCGWGAKNTVFKRCNFQFAAENHLQFNNGSIGGTISECTFDTWNLRGMRNYAIQAIDKGSGPLDISECVFRASVKGKGGDHSAIMNDEDSWIRNVRGCRFEGRGGNLSADGVVIWHPTKEAKEITIEDNTFAELGGVSIILQEINHNGADPVIKVRRNRVLDSCQADTLDKEAIRVRDIASNTDVSLEYNLIRNTLSGRNEHHGFGIEGAQGVKLFNNTVIGCDDAVCLRKLSTAVDIRNNLLHANRGAGIRVAPACSVTTLSHNCLSENARGNYIGLEPGKNDVQKNPQIAEDGRLMVKSPCIDAGEDLGTSFDLEGRRVPVGKTTDIGALEMPADQKSTEPR